MQGPNKLLLLDKDGTLIAPKYGKWVNDDPTNQRIIPGAAETLAAWVEAGWKPVICSNQGGVDSGYKTEEQAIAEMSYAMSLFQPSIQCAYFCPSAPLHGWRLKMRQWLGLFKTRCIDVQHAYSDVEVWGESSKLPFSNSSVADEYDMAGGMGIHGYRKPGGMMLFLAVELNNLPRQDRRVLYVGDRPEDEQAAAAVGYPFRQAQDWLGSPPL